MLVHTSCKSCKWSLTDLWDQNRANCNYCSCYFCSAAFIYKLHFDYFNDKGNATGKKHVNTCRRRGTKIIKSMEHLSHEEKLVKFRFFSLEKRRLRDGLLVAFQYLKEVYKKWRKTFARAWSDRTTGMSSR